MFNPGDAGSSLGSVLMFMATKLILNNVLLDMKSRVDILLKKFLMNYWLVT